MGIDEAGRGCVLGPLVFGAVVVDAGVEADFARLGVRDSKLLSPKRRELLRDEIVRLAAAWRTLAIPARDLDAESLHRLGTGAIVKLALDLRPTVLILDAPLAPAGIPRWVAELRVALAAGGLGDVEIVAENRADVFHPVVSAASILAKTERDGLLRQIEAAVGVDLGSGYPGDERTRGFLRESWERDRGFPPFVRTKWETVQRIVRGDRQGRLL